MNKTLPNNSKLSEVTVTTIGIHGDGIANGADGRYYIPFSAPGDHLAVKPVEARNDGLYAKIEKIITPGAGRIDPVCRHFETCGGCRLQHIEGDAIASLKRSFVATALARRGLADGKIEDTLNIAPGQRRRVRLAVHKKKGPAVVGFREPRGRRVIDIQQCPAIRPAIAGLVDPLRKLAERLSAFKGTSTVQISESETGLDLLLEPGIEAELDLEDRESLAHFANSHDLARIAWRGAYGPVEYRGK